MGRIQTERSGALSLLGPEAGAWRHTLFTWFCAHLLRSAYLHVHTWLSNNYVRSLFLNYNASFDTSCLLFELTPTTDHMGDVQAWRNDDDWQLINNTWLWLDERIQGPQNQSLYAIQNMLTHDDTAIYSRSRPGWGTDAANTNWSQLMSFYTAI